LATASDLPPRLKVPPNAADCHIHIYDPRYAPPVTKPANATVADYRRLQQRLGLTRVVIVTPRNYGTDNSVTLDAVAELGLDNARAVAVVRPGVTRAELERLDRAGTRGIRFTVANPETAVTSIEMIEPLSRQIADLGWHVQLNMEADQIADNAGMLRRLPSQIVFDHLGKLPPGGGTSHPAYRVILELVQAGRAWVKVSGAYLRSAVGPPNYPEATAVAQSYVKAVPERLVWGSDWPHPTPEVPPDDAMLLDLLLEWAPDERVRNRILVENPQKLYGFPSTT
jgi:D-galactarolactone isomerase